MAVPNINIQPAKHTLKINTVSGFAFTPQNIQHGFNPTPVNQALIALAEVDNVAIAGPVAIPVLGGITMQPDINIEVGSSTDSIVRNLLSSFRYDFPNWTDNEVAIGTQENNFISGDIVLITTSNSANTYGSTMVKANTNNIETGAKQCLFIFESHLSNNLKLLHKGYYDLPESSVSAWAPGKTIYLNAAGKIDIVPSTLAGHWVRSLGFCIPNTENKKRVWFEPDTTYLKIA
tara:strand:- start:1256 stop:1954 length:699 start_codon:yes stop_codon:yes gene_type:complete